MEQSVCFLFHVLMHWKLLVENIRLSSLSKFVLVLVTRLLLVQGMLPWKCHICFYLMPYMFYLMPHMYFIVECRLSFIHFLCNLENATTTLKRISVQIVDHLFCMFLQGFFNSSCFRFICYRILLVVCQRHFPRFCSLWTCYVPKLHPLPIWSWGRLSVLLLCTLMTSMIERFSEKIWCFLHAAFCTSFAFEFSP